MIYLNYCEVKKQYGISAGDTVPGKILAQQDYFIPFQFKFKGEELYSYRLQEKKKKKKKKKKMFAIMLKRIGIIQINMKILA